MIKFGFVILLVLCALMGASLYRYAQTPLHSAPAPIAFELMPGNGLRQITSRMQDAGVLPKGAVNALRFQVLARLTGQAARIQAGFYTLDRPVTPVQLLHKLASGDVTPRQIRFIEGWTFAQMRDALNAYPWIPHDSKDMSETEILQAIGIPHVHAEGWFFPSTYDIASRNTDLSILRRAYAIMQQHLAQAWKDRAPDLPYATPKQALIMASIIEKETGVPAERPLTAAVFVNRLRLGMRLQTDPTVIYGMGARFDGNLHKADLQADTPYNTYTRAGLPPTPIAMPGLASIDAALHPANSNDLYFVAKGDGTHCFTQRLVDHNRAVARYQKRS